MPRSSLAQLAPALLLTLLPGCSAEKSADQPQSKAVVDVWAVEFGKVLVGEWVEHTFTIRNDGDTVLRLGKPRKAPTTKPYDIEHRLAEREVPPGESTTLWMRIRPLKATAKLYAGVDIPTNDELGELRMGGRLTVEPLLVLTPAEELPDDELWPLERPERGKPPQVRGTLHSIALDRFRITKMESDHPAVTVQAEPMTAEQLEEFQAKSGYNITVQAGEMSEVGRFSANITLQTDAGEGITKTFRVAGLNRGPVRFLRAQNARWLPRQMTVGLGRFRAGRGTSGSLVFVISTPHGEPGASASGVAERSSLSIDRVDSGATSLKAEVDVDEKRSTKFARWCRLTLHVPPGLPTETRTNLNPVPVTIFTDHPRARTIRFMVQYVSY